MGISMSSISAAFGTESPDDNNNNNSSCSNSSSSTNKINSGYSNEAILESKEQLGLLHMRDLMSMESKACEQFCKLLQDQGFACISLLDLEKEDSASWNTSSGIAN